MLYYNLEAAEIKMNYISALNTFEITGSAQDEVTMINMKKSYDNKLRIVTSDNKSTAVGYLIITERQAKQPCQTCRLVREH